MVTYGWLTGGTRLKRRRIEILKTFSLMWHYFSPLWKFCLPRIYLYYCPFAGVGGDPFVFELVNGRYFHCLKINNIMLLTPWTSIKIIQMRVQSYVSLFHLCFSFLLTIIHFFHLFKGGRESMKNSLNNTTKI